MQKVVKGIFLLPLLAAILVAVMYWQNRPVHLTLDLAKHTFDGGCKEALNESVKINECYEFILQGEFNEHQPITFYHESGKTIKSLTFLESGLTKVRFTGTLAGQWKFENKSLDVIQDSINQLNGFLESANQKWVYSGSGKAIVPQFIMYDGADIDHGINEFVKGHGFTGFHITNLREFEKNPAYFEEVVRKTYEVGGHTHFWIWGDEQRKLTPEYYEGDVDYLYKEILARLGPMPGWSVGYGFDLFEWVVAEDLDAWRASWHEISDYRHLMGGRGYKNEYKPISTNMDYVSWEWHRPSLADYKAHLLQASDKATFSEDRFRIRTPSKYPLKDYDEDDTVIGLWDSLIAGGVANIWGNRGDGAQYSIPYKNKKAIKKYSVVANELFTADAQSTQIVDVDCLQSMSQVICKTTNSNEFQALGRSINIMRIIDPFSGEDLEYSTSKTNDSIRIVIGKLAN